ncbi:MAG: DUF2231 domain-containing protein [Caldilineaceae bacterium]|nr:DUF2231 domain-containing protein [Caldilineaceae bacterium]
MPINLITLHPATVHFPIALLLVGSLAGLLYLWWKQRPELRILTWWLLMLGWIGAGVAALTGLLAQGNLPPQAPYTPVLNGHISSGLALIVVYAALFYRVWLHRNRRSATDPADLLDVPGARLWLSLLLLLGMALVALGGWLGGQLVYTWGVNVGE